MMLRALARACAAALALAACKKEAPPPPVPEPAGGAAVQTLAAIVATCASGVGDVQVRRAGSQAWESVATGAVFRAGDEVRTGPLAFVRVEFLTGGGLELEEKASVVIDVKPPERGASDAGAAAAENRVAVKEGIVRGFLPQATEGVEVLGLVITSSDGSEMRLAAKPGKKPAAFRVARGAKGTELAVTAGEARIVGKKGETALRSGQVAVVAAGAVTETAELIDFPASVEPGIDARFHFKPELAIRLAWNPVQGAAGYRVQVAHDLSFQAIDEVQDVEGASTTFRPRSPGVHAWRVASRDRAGRHGEYGFARRLHCEQEAPRDLLVGPADGHAIRFVDRAPPVAFSWESAGAAHSYRVVVATGPDLLERKVMSVVSRDQQVELDGIAPGEYWWGVYVEDGKVPEPIFTRARRLSIQKVQKPKAKLPKSISEWGD